MTATYWLLGRRIVEQEQKGAALENARFHPEAEMPTCREHGIMEK